MNIKETIFKNRTENIEIYFIFPVYGTVADSGVQ